MKPEEELKRLNRLIRQFESVYKSTTDPHQKDRVGKQIKDLKDYKKKIESFHVIDEEELSENIQYDEFEGFPLLKMILEKRKQDGEKDRFEDREIYHLSLYCDFFEQEFLSLLSETKLKLDFKHSLERDSFYHRFENLLRQFKGFREDISRIAQYNEKHEEDMLKRGFKKKNILLEGDRFFRSLSRFSGDLIEDIKNDGLMCLNANDLIHFDKLEGNRYLEGFPVREALVRLNKFVREVISFLNIPQIESQE